jgi:parvulin-like peptidyl-prolyl isomerase
VTTEDRNRRIKYGHNVPRWWIPEFNNTHRKDGEDQAIEATSQSTENATADELLKIAKSQGSQQQLFEQQRRWAEHNISQASAARRKAETSTSHEKSNLKQRLRQVKQNEQRRLLNRDIRIAQLILAGLFTLVGGVSAGILGLLVGAAIGILIISFRLKI